MRVGKVVGWIGACGAALLMLGCDRNGNPIEEFGLDKLSKGVSTEAEVRTVMGQPDTVWEEEDGRRTLEYPKGPQGVRTWMFSIAADGRMLDYTQVLTAENFAKVVPGMSSDDVRRLLGRPRTIVPFKRKNEEVWDWRYQNINEPRLFNVHFDMDSHKVVATSYSEISGY